MRVRWGAASSKGQIVIKFGLHEHDGIPRQGFPITGGIALAAGRVREAAQLVLRDAAGRAVPLQARALSHWPDGSVKWVLLDFQADLEAHGRAVLELAEGEAEALPAVGMEGIVDGEPLPRLTCAPRIEGSHVRAVDERGQEWTRREAGPTVVEEFGPLRTLVCTSGFVVSPDGRRHIQWKARTHFYRGQPWTRTQFTYVALAGEEQIRLRELAVVCRVAPPEQASYCFAGSMAPWASHFGPITHPRPGFIYQRDAQDACVVAEDGAVLAPQTLKSRGYIGVAGREGGLALGLAEMWQSFPKLLRSARDSLQAVLWPAQAEVRLALTAGVARTHLLTLTPYRTAEELDAFMTGLQTPIQPRLELEQWNQTGLTAPLLSPEQSTVPFLETLTRSMFTGFTTYANRANAGVWGLGDMHWGDFRAESYEARALPSHYGEGVVWGNGEAQVPYGLLVQYLRTGRIECLLHGLACARHEADVDTIHDAQERWRVGGQYSHCAGHTAGSLTTSHMWASGIALAYCLTGDARLREVLEETGAHLSWMAQESDLRAFEARDGGWLLIALCALSEALDEPSYLERGRRVLRGIRDWIERGATMLLPPRMRVHTPVHLFIALTGVADLYRLTGDGEARETLLAGGELALRKGRDESGFFFIADGQAYRNAGRWPACHSLPVLDVLYQITGEKRWIEVGMHQARLMLRMLESDTRWGPESNWAQGGIYFAYAFGFFETARRLGLLTDIS